MWAPAAQAVDVVFADNRVVKLRAEGGGYFAGLAPGVRHGDRYKLRLGGSSDLVSDPASRFQPDGPFGSSQLIDHRFPWTDQTWQGARIDGQIIYEMHIGTFTKEGTWRAAAAQLAELASAGITLLEVMPVSDFPGRFGWGYDGVNLFAPTWLYGTPEDFRFFVNTAHANGIGVILDVVYNHLGPDGNYLGRFSKDYFSAKYKTDWGEAINFDGENSAPVREYFLTNAAYWVSEFHLDGLRVDATQNIYDASKTHILADLSRVVRSAAKGRSALLIGENEPQDSRLVREFGFDGLWNDDFHHSAVVALTGRSEAYYNDYAGRAQELISAVKHGFLYQGQRYSWQKQRRGKPALDIPPQAFVNFIQNHDQVANSAQGLRIDRLSHPGSLRAMTALLILAPNTPMLFQGQEFASGAPFFYFSDHKPEISKLVFEGRNEFLSQFRSIGEAITRAGLPDPGNPATFEQCKLDFADRQRHAPMYSLHKDLIQLRRSDPVFAQQRKGTVDGAVLGTRAFVLRFFGPANDDRLLVVNFDIDRHLAIAPEPLLAPVADLEWRVLFSTEDPKYGGSGVYAPEVDGEWWIPGAAAIVLKPREVHE